jgi:hypothetical protein
MSLNLVPSCFIILVDNSYVQIELRRMGEIERNLKVKIYEVCNCLLQSFFLKFVFPKNYKRCIVQLEIMRDK